MNTATLVTLRILIFRVARTISIIFVSALLVTSTPVYAVDLQVCPSGCPFSSVQAAVDAAGDGDVIKVTGGTYTGVQLHNAPTGYPGLSVVKQLVYLDKSITIRGGYTTDFSEPPDAAANPTILDAQSQGRVLFISGNIAPIIEGLTLQGGEAAGQGGSLNNLKTVDAGGGAYVMQAAPRFNGNRFIGNAAVDGAGLYLTESRATLQGNRISNNQADYGGGLFLFSSPAVMEANVIKENTAVWEGGGLYLDHSPATLTNNELGNNQAGSYGGGVSLWQSAAALSDNLLHHNHSKYIGGGVSSAFSQLTLRANVITSNSSQYNCGGVAIADGTATVEQNLITGNAAILGGGLCAERGQGHFAANQILANSSRTAAGGLFMELMSSTTLENNVVADNHADILGGGIYISASQLTINHTTIARNGSNEGSGLLTRDWMGFPSEVNLFNTILVSQPIGIQALMNTVVRLEGTLWGAGSWDNGVDTAGSGVTEIGLHNYYLEPGFVDPDDGNYHLQSSSPAIDRGVPVDTAVDMDNETRPMGAAPDLGADEVPADPTNPITWSPVALDPLNGATDQPTTLMLRWQTDSLRSDQAVYTVHLGTENPPQAIAEIGETSYAASLEANRTYYWSITIFDGTNSLPGPVWYFTTTKSGTPSLPEQNQLYLPLLTKK